MSLHSSEPIDLSRVRYAVVDAEVGVSNKCVADIGALRADGAVFHKNSKAELALFLRGADYVCGHNIVAHDACYLFGLAQPASVARSLTPDGDGRLFCLVDTLHVSPLLFPERPYHRLLKDDKLCSEQANDPVADCRKAENLLCDEVARWLSLSPDLRRIYDSLLGDQPFFAGFMRIARELGGLQQQPPLSAPETAELIRRLFRDRICSNANLHGWITHQPVALAYALALILTTSHHSISPRWLTVNYPQTEDIVRALRRTPCADGCSYCQHRLDPVANLRYFFRYDNFRTYNGRPLQEDAVRAAVAGQSLLAVFPTGGGKSLTFQLPALIDAHAVHGLTVVVSPLQSLMKDQVDNLEKKGITDSATINGLLNPVERARVIERVADGSVSILYIAPESLRSRTIERLLMGRHVVRFVIDEAHCFSSWGQDFRVDYLYIGKFLKKYQQTKNLGSPVPVSCFTATAKQKVVQDICDYFRKEVGVELRLFTSEAERSNLTYNVERCEADNDKYQRLRSLILETDGPAIVYVSRTKRTTELADRLAKDGFAALPFNGKMDPDQKVRNQNDFMEGRVQVIVATSAFGMGVDKDNVALVVHYDISDSLENYVQEAGRAGRDPGLQAHCHVLFAEGDLDKHFMLLNQTRLSFDEIKQVWRAVCDLTRQRDTVQCSALEIARLAGWKDDIPRDEMETRVRQAIATLEDAGLVERGNNVPQVYATGITVGSVDEGRRKLDAAPNVPKAKVETAVRVLASLISKKHTHSLRDAEAESRVDYLADTLGLSKRDVLDVVELMRQEGILADSQDLSAFLYDTGVSNRKAEKTLDEYSRLEHFILSLLTGAGQIHTSSKQINTQARQANVHDAKETNVHTLVNFLGQQEYVDRSGFAGQDMTLCLRLAPAEAEQRFKHRIDICRFVLKRLFEIAGRQGRDNGPKAAAVTFSLQELIKGFNGNVGGSLFAPGRKAAVGDVQESLLYLSRIGALKIEGGFMVLYNALSIKRLGENNKGRFLKKHYDKLQDFHRQKTEQVHIVGRYAKMMIDDPQAAQLFVHDYFHSDYQKFISKYFKSREERAQMKRNVSPERYNKIFGSLSPLQQEIISDKDSNCIVVAAGPGSGKTRVLVHKLASLYTLEEVKHEQLLMLTFSRAAATEFKMRLLGLIGNAAHYVEIKTFHSYCFDLLGRVGNIEETKDVVERAAQMIEADEVEHSKITKTVLVIDEAQDMSAQEARLVRAIAAHNDGLRIIAVGDDDQNIYAFRGSDSRHFFELRQMQGARFVEMTDNYRSHAHIVHFANAFASTMTGRLKQAPIVSMTGQDGWVEVVHHEPALPAAVHNGAARIYGALLPTVRSLAAQDSVCVLTQNNEEAAIVAAMLLHDGIDCRLIQAADDFSLPNMAELRYFVRLIERETAALVIPPQVWADAKESLCSQYAGSTSLVYALNCIEAFEKTSGRLYVADFKEFMAESHVEDFSRSDSEPPAPGGRKVVVSTIHKAKGREFDSVVMLVAAGPPPDEERKRALYVGITRAKKRLVVHTTSTCFNPFVADIHRVDPRAYPLPAQIALTLSMKDVYLDFFIGRKKNVLALQGGAPLSYDNGTLCVPDTGMPIVRLSGKMMDKLDLWTARGYVVESANVNFVVAWRKKQEAEEFAVLLPNIVLGRKD